MDLFRMMIGKAEIRTRYIRIFVFGTILGLATSVGISLGCAWFVDVNVPVTRASASIKSSDSAETRGLKFTSTSLGVGISWKKALAEGWEPGAYDGPKKPFRYLFKLNEYRWGWPTPVLFHREIFAQRILHNGPISFRETANAFDLRKLPRRRDHSKPQSPRGDLIPLGVLWVGCLVGTALWGSIWSIIIIGMLRLRQAIRVYRGKCPQCGYCLFALDAAGCPECGWNRPKDESKTAEVVGIQNNE